MKVKIKPAAGLKIKRPDTLIYLKEEGEVVKMDTFWRRRIKDGDVELMEEIKTEVVKAEPKAEAKAEVKTEVKAEVKTEAKAEVKTEAKPEAKVEKKDSAPKLPTGPAQDSKVSDPVKKDDKKGGK